MTPQEIFDKAYLGLKAQGRRSLGNTGCAYNSPDGLHCGVGFVVDRDLSATWEGYRIGYVAARDPERNVPGWVVKNVDLLVAIQSAHDSAECWGSEYSGFEAKFASVAKRFNLTIPQVTA